MELNGVTTKRKRRPAIAVSIIGVACWTLLMMGGATIVASAIAPTAAANCIQASIPPIHPPSCDNELNADGCFTDNPDEDIPPWNVNHWNCIPDV